VPNMRGLIAIVCVGASVMYAFTPYLTSIVPLPETHELNLTSPAYDIVELSAPAADGLVLRVLARVFSNGFGPLCYAACC
jgi:hypothetical protein